MKTVLVYALTVIWCYHLATGVAAWAAAYRIWPERRNQFVKLTMIHLHAAVFDAVGAFVCLLLAQGVKFTWKFTITLFAFVLLRDLVRLPLILYILRGPRKRKEGAGPKHSRDFGPNHTQRLPEQDNR